MTFAARLLVVWLSVRLTLVGWLRYRMRQLSTARLRAGMTGRRALGRLLARVLSRLT